MARNRRNKKRNSRAEDRIDLVGEDFVDGAAGGHQDPMGVSGLSEMDVVVEQHGPPRSYNEIRGYRAGVSWPRRQVTQNINRHGVSATRTTLRCLNYPEEVINAMFYELGVLDTSSSSGMGGETDSFSEAVPATGTAQGRRGIASPSDRAMTTAVGARAAVRAPTGEDEEARSRAVTKTYPYGGYGDLYSRDRKKANHLGRNLFLFDNEVFYTYSRDADGKCAVPYPGRASGEVELGFDDGLMTSGLESGLKYTFKEIHDIANSSTMSTEDKFRSLASCFSPENLQGVLSQCKNEDLQEKEQVLHYDIVPCPRLLKPDDKDGWLSKSTRKDFKEAIQNRRFSGESGTKITCNDFLQELAFFAEDQLGPEASYILLKTYTEGRANAFVRHCLDTGTAFNYCWTSFNRMFAKAYEPFKARKKLVELLDTRPTNLVEYFLKMVALCKEASYSFPAESRPAWKIRQHRETILEMLSRWFPAHKRAILQKEQAARHSWILNRDRIRRMNEDPDDPKYANGSNYHSVLTLQDLCHDELDHVHAVSETPHSRRLQRSARAAMIDIDENSVSKVDYDDRESTYDTYDYDHMASDHGEAMSVYEDIPEVDESSDVDVAAIGTRGGNAGGFQYRPRPGPPGTHKPQQRPSKPIGKDRGRSSGSKCRNCGHDSHQADQCYVQPGRPIEKQCDYCGNFHPGECVKRKRDEVRQAGAKPVDKATDSKPKWDHK